MLPRHEVAEDGEALLAAVFPPRPPLVGQGGRLGEAHEGVPLGEPRLEFLHPDGHLLHPPRNQQNGHAPPHRQFGQDGRPSRAGQPQHEFGRAAVYGRLGRRIGGQFVENVKQWGEVHKAQRSGGAGEQRRIVSEAVMGQIGKGLEPFQKNLNHLVIYPFAHCSLILPLWRDMASTMPSRRKVSVARTAVSSTSRTSSNSLGPNSCST